MDLVIRRQPAALIALALIIAGSAALAAPAQAWYVDISITGAGRVYETTDANELDEHCPAYEMEGFASPSTTPTGSLGASCRAGDAGGDYGHGWVVRYVAEAAAGYSFAGWQSDGRTNPGPVLCDGSDGSSSYAGAACQFATFQNLQTRARFVDDTNPTMSSLTGPNQPVNGSASFMFSASADPTLRGFECRVAGVHDWQACSSGRSENPPTGSYTFEVRGFDWSNNRSAISEWEWTVDKVTPETTLTSGPTEGSTTESTAATFEFSSTEGGGFECSLDGAAFAACTSPAALTGLGLGPHTFRVRASDVAGNVDGTPVARSWTISAPASGGGDGGDAGGVGGGDAGVVGAELDISAALARDARKAAKMLRKLGLKKLLSKSEAKVTVNALTAGQLVAQLKGRLAGAKKAATIAKAKRTFDSSGRAKLKLKLTRKGEKLLKTARKAKAKVEGVLELKFLADSGATAKAKSKVKLKR